MMDSGFIYYIGFKTSISLQLQLLSSLASASSSFLKIFMLCALTMYPASSNGLLIFVFSTVKLILRTGDGIQSLFYGDRDVLKDGWRVVGCFVDVFGNTIRFSVGLTRSVGSKGNVYEVY